MITVDRYVRRALKPLMQWRIGVDVQAVSVLIVVIVVDMRNGIRNGGFNVGVQRASRRDVENLCASADGEDGDVCGKCVTDECKLDAIAFRVRRGIGRVLFGDMSDAFVAQGMGNGVVHVGDILTFDEQNAVDGLVGGQNGAGWNCPGHDYGNGVVLQQQGQMVFADKVDVLLLAHQASTDDEHARMSTGVDGLLLLWERLMHFCELWGGCSWAWGKKLMATFVFVGDICKRSVAVQRRRG